MSFISSTEESDMGEYIDIGGHPTWVERFGSADADETVVLLHGGISNGDDLRAAAAQLEDRYRLVSFDRRGHGRTADTDRPFSYVEMAEETVGVLEQVVGEPAALVGWSDGGIVALLVALSRPDLVRSMVLIGTDFHFEGVRPFGQDPAMEAAFESMKSSYLERSPDGVEHFPVMLAKATHLMETEPRLTTDDIATIATPTLVLVGDDDLIELGHTVALYEALPAGRLAVVPAASHLVPVEQPELVGRLIADFLAAPEPPRTMMPSRRTTT
jgi:pimeloyl-ACP methyl ester carboxylesterase